ncbi:Uncharacterized protein TCM_000058 [Theobroma cacao]|uniref:Uncharacterized protein n=1 Tax=Theobroma cacao TaxID=3641 RepID=A0A061DF29_THECC|nr:Uncharacterized protein TCM_000058 [Theobroma cacao]
MEFEFPLLVGITFWNSFQVIIFFCAATLWVGPECLGLGAEGEESIYRRGKEFTLKNQEQGNRVSCTLFSTTMSNVSLRCT